MSAANPTRAQFRTVFGIERAVRKGRVSPKQYDAAWEVNFRGIPRTVRFAALEASFKPHDPLTYHASARLLFKREGCPLSVTGGAQQ